MKKSGIGRAGARVEIAAEGERIVLTPARRRHVLAELLEGVTPEAMREAFDRGPDRGRESVARGVQSALSRSVFAKSSPT